MIAKMLRDILTNADGITYCHSRVSGGLTTIIYWGMALTKVIQSHEIDFVQFATGYAAILVAIGGSVYLKKSTESS